jgi:hypothetical protein
LIFLFFEIKRIWASFVEINSKSEELFVLEVDLILGAYEVSDVIFAFVDKSFDV